MFVTFVERSGKNARFIETILFSVSKVFFFFCSFWHKIYAVLSHVVQHGFFPYFELKTYIIPAV